MTKRPNIQSGTRIGSYEIIGPLGAGGMGEVYRARDTDLGRVVAVKVLRADFANDRDRLDRFKREARAASALNHPNIVTIHGFGESNAMPYIVMELVAGRTLREVLDQGPLPVEQVIDIGLQTAEGLAKAHAVGIVHRDLKPENLMLTEDGYLKILDFGLAKLLSVEEPGSVLATLDGGTAAGMILGSAGYMSPEQASGKPVDTWTDQFSMGVILYEMATGQRPFRRPSVPQTLAAIIEMEPTPPDTLNPGLPQSLVRLIQRLMSKKPRARYDDTREVPPLLREMSSAPAGRTTVAPVASARACPRCAAPTPTDNRFCGVCGAPVERTCTGCGAELDDEVRFCGQCGRAADTPQDTLLAASEMPTAVDPNLSSAGPLSAGERRQTTIACASLSGYTRLLEQLDPVELRAAMGLVRERLATTIERHGGLLHRFEGGEMVALFGLPTTHEDDYLRAVHGLREAQEQLDALEQDSGTPVEPGDLRLHAGIHTGSVIVQQAGDDSGELEVSGRTLLLSRQLAGEARAGEIRVSDTTRRLVAPYFETERSDSFEHDGDSVGTWKVLARSAARTRLDAAKQVGLTSFTGRHDELALLWDAASRARRGDGTFIALGGEAGAGKSRLVHEFRNTLDGDAIRLVEGRCKSYGEGNPYAPFISAMRDCLELGDADLTNQDAEAMVHEIRAIDPALEPFVPFYLSLLSIHSAEHPVPEHLKGDELRLSVREALAAICIARAAEKPLVLVLEDWHWSDEASREALRHLIGLAPTHRMLIVVSFRPDAEIDWGKMGTPTVVMLQPLDRDSSATIMRSVLAVKTLPRGLGRLIHERTGGNPFFVEEVCRALRERGALRIEGDTATLVDTLHKLDLPDSIQGVIRSRLDRLDNDTRDLLRHAAVIGREFSRRVLKRALTREIPLEQSLQRLQELHIVQQVAVIPEARYRFNHALTLEVTYEGLLPRQRKALHQAAGEAIEQFYENRLDEQLDSLARHFAHAENWLKAVEYGKRASRRAARVGRYVESVRMAESTHDWMARLDPEQVPRAEVIALLLEQERLCEVLGRRERQLALVDELLALVVDPTDPGTRAVVLGRQGELLAQLGRFDEAERSLSEALVIRRELGDRTGERNALRSISFLRWQEGLNAEAIDLMGQALEISREFEDHDGIVNDLTNIASLMRGTGQLDRALEVLTEAGKILNVNPVVLVYTSHVRATIYRARGDNDLALALYRKTYEFQEANNLWLHRSVTLNAVANILLERGDIDEGLETFERVVRMTRKINYTQELASSLRRLGNVLFTLGRLDDALPHFVEATETFAQLAEPSNQAACWSKIATIHERAGRLDAARAAWGSAEQLYRAAGQFNGEVEAVEALARVARATGADSHEVQRIYEKALQLATELDDTEKKGDLLNTLGILAWTAGNYDEALARYETALEVFGRLDGVRNTGLILNSIGVTLQRLGRLDEAKQRLHEALEANRGAGQQDLEAHSLAALGDVCSAVNDSDAALAHFTASLAIRTELNDRVGEGWMSLKLAGIHQSLGNTQQAHECLDRATISAGASGNTRLQQACTEFGAR